MKLFVSSLNSNNSTQPIVDDTTKDGINYLIDFSINSFSGFPTLNANDYLGSTDSETIDNLIAQKNIIGKCIIELTGNGRTGGNLWTINKAIELPSNTILKIDGQTIKGSNGMFDNLIRQSGVVVDEIDVGNKAVNIPERSNIHIIGLNGATLEGSSSPLYGRGDYYGWRQIGVLFANCNTYSISGFTVKNTPAWGITSQCFSTIGRVENIIFNQNYVNGDGIDFRKSTNRSVIRNISGKTSDDSIAINGILRPLEGRVYPMMVEGNEDFYTGLNVSGGEYNDIKHIYIDNLSNSFSLRAIRLLTSDGVLLHDVEINDVSMFDNPQTSTIYIHGKYGSSTEASDGDVYNITINNISNELRTPLSIDMITNNVSINGTNGILANSVKSNQLNFSIINDVNGTNYF